MQSNRHETEQAYHEKYPNLSQPFDPSMEFESGPETERLRYQALNYPFLSDPLASNSQQMGQFLGYHNPWLLQNFDHTGLGRSGITASTSGLDFDPTLTEINSGIMNYDFLNEMSGPFPDVILPTAVPDNVSYNQDNFNDLNILTLPSTVITAPPVPATIPQAGPQRFACTSCTCTYKRDKDPPLDIRAIAKRWWEKKDD
ncbi:hypothetical protein BGZ60DRAFT_527103 [Tricladium varicosporioides]|nr:hypothetical protein BGZ60DRAFT_527103 [Hymenoscyphus varicosporioides]